ncbi:CTP synthase [Candidatus Woesearchaeota archaeon]|nr:CTP synthase [Candidatus Woesearchaeota archaeon]
MKTKFVVITGGVLSGLGKGVVTASIGSILKAQGYKVSAVKIDPYINVDAGTMRPTEHGEVFVTEDGGETDQDLGNYERFFDENIFKKHNITTGQVYLNVIQKERNLEYDGKCVEVIPHIPLEVRRRIFKVAKDTKADYVMIEVGGTIGDYQNVLFLEALREMKREYNNMIFVHVAYLPVPGNIGEMKTKPAQHSVRALNASGIQPDIIIARASNMIDKIRREKLSTFCNVKEDAVIGAPDVFNIYEVPLIFEKQGLGKKIVEKFGKKYKKGKLSKWESLIKKTKKLKKTVKIGIVGKYFDIGDFTLEDSYISVIEAIKHASWNNSVNYKIEWIDSKKYEKNKSALKELDKYNGVIVPGGFGYSGVEGKILAIEYVRKKKIPYLGICYGMQLAVVEFARNVCKLEGANTTENEKNVKHPVIDILPEQIEKLKQKKYGATMRLGTYPAKLKRGTKVRKLYKNKGKVDERHRHRYEVNPEYIERLEKKGLVFSGKSPDRSLMEFMELPKHPYFVGAQAHPEFKSRPFRPAPLFDGLIKAAIKKRIK